MGSPLGFRSILGRGRIEFALEVPVAEAVDGKVAGQHRGEEVDGVRVDRVEGSDTGACCRAGPAQRVEFRGGLAREGHAGQRIQETTVGGNLSVAPEIGDALGHRTPPRRLVRPVFRRAEHLEHPRIVDVDPEHVGVVVELDGLRRKRTRQPSGRRLLSIVTSPANAGCGLRPRKCRTSVAPSAVTAAVTKSPWIASSAARSGNRMSLAYSPWSITRQEPAKPAAVMAGSSGLTSTAWRSRTGSQSVWANRWHSAATAAAASIAVILLSLRRSPIPSASSWRASHSRPLT